MSEAAEQAARTTVRDKKVDYIGCVQELEKHLVKDLRTEVKLTLNEKGADVAEGDVFRGLLVESETRTIDARKFYKRFQAEEMTEKEFLDAISVSTTSARKLMSEKELNAISTIEPAAPKLVVSRKPDVSPISLVQAAQSVLEAVK